MLTITVQKQTAYALQPVTRDQLTNRIQQIVTQLYKDAYSGNARTVLPSHMPLRGLTAFLCTIGRISESNLYTSGIPFGTDTCKEIVIGSGCGILVAAISTRIRSAEKKAWLFELPVASAKNMVLYLLDVLCVDAIDVFQDTANTIPVRHNQHVAPGPEVWQDVAVPQRHGAVDGIL